MNSEELNEKISLLDDMDDPPFCAFGEKPIPYIGWFWREVDFDKEAYTFGIVPGANTRKGLPVVGFMENNKWDYSTVRVTPEQSKEIRRLLEIAVQELTAENLRAVNDAIQGLLPVGERP